jgi:hypothetical protein
MRNQNAIWLFDLLDVGTEVEIRHEGPIAPENPSKSLRIESLFLLRPVGFEFTKNAFV